MRLGAVAAITILLAAGLLSLPADAQGGPAAAPWTEGPVADDASDPVPVGMPFGDGRHMRVHLRVDVPSAFLGATDLPAMRTLDIAQILRAKAGYPALPTGQLLGFQLDLGSFSLVEVDPDTLAPLHMEGGRAVREALLVFPGSFEDARPFDARSNPVVTLQWVLRGASMEERHYMLYFDALHNGRKTPATVSEAALAGVASSIGPGRGDRIYVSLHGDLGIQTSQDPRAIRVTNLHQGSTSVDVRLYDRFGIPQSTPVAQATLSGLGQTQVIRFPSQYTGSAVLVEAHGGLVLVEASSSVTSTQYAAGSGRMFLPAADGGYTGKVFTETPVQSTTWLVFCPKIAANAGDCAVSVAGGAAQTVRQNDFIQIQVAGGQPVVLRAVTGEVAVQRVASQATGLHPTQWPPLDGPVRSSLFMGHALSTNPSDKLLLMPAQAGSAISVRDMVGSKTLLTDRLEVGGPGLFTDTFGDGWGTAWDRSWRVRSDPGTPRLHQDGPARIDAVGGGPLTVVSGLAQSGFSALVPLQSGDGGLRYSFSIPADDRGIPLGRIVLFSPHSGTNVVASGINPSGEAKCCITRLALQKDQFVHDLITEAGWWAVEADRPVLLVWQRVGSSPMGGFAPGVTDALQVHVVSAQHAGFLFDVQPDQSFRTVRPGTSAEFVVRVQNLARAVDGTPVPDLVEVEAIAPSGWPTPQVSPRVLQLGAGGQDSADTVRVKVQVPTSPTVNIADGGATVTLNAFSRGEPRLAVTQALGINYLVERGVQVTANGSPLDAQMSAAPGEDAVYHVLVTNTGSVRDRFLIEHSLAAGGWGVDVQCFLGGFQSPQCTEDGSLVTPLLEPQKSMELIFTVTPAAGATASRLPLTFLATSQSDPSEKASIRLVTQIAFDRALTVRSEDTSRVVPPSASSLFHLVIENGADIDEELDLHVEALLPPGWARPDVEILLVDADERVSLEALGGVVPVPRQSKVEAWIKQPVPAGAPPYLLGLDRVVIESRLSSSAPRITAELRTIVEETRGFQATATPDRISTVPGGEIRFAVTYTSLGNGVQNLTVTPVPHGGTGWAFVDGSGLPPPWSIDLPAGGQAALQVSSKVPADAPAIAGGMRLDLRSGVPAHPELPVPVLLEVAPESAFTTKAGTLVLRPGHDNKITVAVTNAGNTLLDLEGRWMDLPWGVHPAQTRLAVGASGALPFTINVPAPLDPSVVPPTARLVIQDHGSQEAETQIWNVRIAAPSLSAVVSSVSDFSGGGRVFRVDVANTGDVAAYDVQVDLVKGDRILDTARIDNVLPGDARVANLVTREAGTPEVRVRAQHAPDGFEATYSVTDPPRDDRDIPAGSAILALVVLAACIRRYDR